jgi:3-oxoadipate enol-lactonase
MVGELAQTRIEEAQPLEAWQAQAMAGAAHDAYDRVGGIAVPTLVATGTADEVVDPRNAELLTGRIPGAELKTYEGLGHLFFWQDPQRFVADLEAFLC